MKRFILSLMLVCAIFVAQSQYYYPYDGSNYYYDDSPSLIIQKDKIMGWYVSDIDGKRISDYYEDIRPFSQGHAAVKDKIVKEFLTTTENQYYIQSKKQAGYNNSQKTT